MEQRRRNSFDIMADMIKTARNGARKTRIVYQCNLNFKIVKRYLGYMIDKGLIYFEAPNYYSTDEGETYLSRYKSLSTELGTLGVE